MNKPQRFEAPKIANQPTQKTHSYSKDFANTNFETADIPDEKHYSFNHWLDNTKNLKIKMANNISSV